MNNIIPTRSGTRMTTRYAPCSNFSYTTMASTTAVRTAPAALIASRQCQPASRTRSQCRTIPVWLRVKHRNTPTEYSGMSAWVSPSNAHSRPNAIGRQQDDAPRVRQAIAAEGELAGHVAVLGEDRGEAREGVEARVRGEEQDERGAHREQPGQRRARAEGGARGHAPRSTGRPPPSGAGRSRWTRRSGRRTGCRAARP